MVLCQNPFFTNPPFGGFMPIRACLNLSANVCAIPPERSRYSYLGHSNIQHTVRYTELASTKFQGLWDS